jgi:4-amino-4-deoxy-L-arabinose transferase-like glycosyltransferase
MAYRLFGVHETTAFVVNALAMAATVFSVYLLTWALFDDRLAAWFAALLMALTPQQLVWSATAAVEPTASLACVTALLCAALFVRSRSTAALAATACSAAYAIQFRPESPLVLPVIGLLLWRAVRPELGSARLWWCGLLFVTLASANIGHLVAVRNESWGTSDARLSLEYVIPNLRVNGWFYLGDWRFPIVFTLAAIVGLSGRGFGRDRVAMVGYFALFFTIDLLFYAGSYNYGADVRYSLLTYPPIAILGGLGARRFSTWIPRSTVNGARAAVAGALAFQFMWYLPGVRATTEEAWAARADVRFARSFVRNLPPNSFVLTHNPGMFHVWGVNAGQMSLLVSSPTYLEQLSRRFAGGVYLHWNFWCNVADPVQQEFCRLALSRGPATLVNQYRERNYRYAIYRLGERRTDAADRE